MSAAHLTPADGPADPPSSRPRAGVLPGPVFAFAFDPSSGEQRVDVPGLTDLEISPDTVLHWAFYADGPAATLSPHAALAVTVDVRFADGARLSDTSAVRDRYDFPLTAQAQFAARWSLPEQWNAGQPSPSPPSHAAAARSRSCSAPHPSPAPTTSPARCTGFVQVVVEAQAPARDLSPVERVDTRRGSHSGPRFSSRQHHPGGGDAARIHVRHTRRPTRKTPGGPTVHSCTTTRRGDGSKHCSSPINRARGSATARCCS